jgi:hypothetical protein
VYQRFKRGILEVEALVTPDRAGHYLKLISPRAPWSEVNKFVDGSVHLIIRVANHPDLGIEALHTAVAGQGGLCSFEDIVNSLRPEYAARLVGLREQLAACIAMWKTLGQPPSVKIETDDSARALLVEVLLRRHSRLAMPEHIAVNTRLPINENNVPRTVLQFRVFEDNKGAVVENQPLTVPKEIQMANNDERPLAEAQPVPLAEEIQVPLVEAHVLRVPGDVQLPVVEAQPAPLTEENQVPVGETQVLHVPEELQVLAVQPLPVPLVEEVQVPVVEAQPLSIPEEIQEEMVNPTRNGQTVFGTDIVIMSNEGVE